MTTIEPNIFLELIEYAKCEVKGPIPAHQQQMLERDIPLWIAALEAALTDVDNQIAMKREQLDLTRSEVQSGVVSADTYQADKFAYDQWSRKIARFRLGLVQRQVALRAIDNATGEQLMNAIREHRDTNSKDDEDDQRLYDVLDKVTEARQTVLQSEHDRGDND